MHRVFSLFVAVCLCLGQLPCTMAMDAGEDHGCPHCPPSESQGHHGHHGSSDEVKDARSCAEAIGDCGSGDSLNVDGRGANPQLQDLLGDPEVALGSLYDPMAFSACRDLTGDWTARSPPPEYQPPLNVLHCVYLN